MRFIYFSFHGNALVGNFAQKGLPECFDGCRLFLEWLQFLEKMITIVCVKRAK